MICHTFLLVCNGLEFDCRGLFQLSLLFQVVIPLQTKGFYNNDKLDRTVGFTSCHTSPNERLLQRWDVTVVVQSLSCHTSPNERLLQLCRGQIPSGRRFLLSYLSKRKASTTPSFLGIREMRKVVIPLQTKGFYNKLNGVVAGTKTLLSYLSKRKASTTSVTTIGRFFQ